MIFVLPSLCVRFLDFPSKSSENQNRKELSAFYLRAMETYPLSFRDGATNQLQYYPSQEPGRPILLLLPAMGVNASFYPPLLSAMQARGFVAAVIDWRGNGQSSVRPSRRVDFGYDELVEDIQEVVAFVRKQFPGRPLYLLGHSLGGQLACVYEGRYPKRVAGIVLIASCSVYHKGYRGKAALRVKLASRVFPFIAGLRGFFPGKRVGFAGTEARTVMRDWSHNVRTGRYEPIGASVDDEARMQAARPRLLAMSFTEDDWVTPQATANLYGKFHPASDLTHVHFGGKEAGEKRLTHFNWVFRHDYLLTQLEAWLEGGALEHVWPGGGSWLAP